MAASVVLVASGLVTVPAAGIDRPVQAAGPGDSVAALVPLTPVRVLDTRVPIGVAVADPVGADGVIDLQVTGEGGVPADGVGGVVLNVTIASATAPTFVTVWPTGESLPLASSLNAVAGQVVANLVVAKVGTGGMVSLYNRAGAADLVADVTGWIPAGADLTTVTPARLMDTRDSTGGRSGPVEGGTSVELDVVGVGGVPDNDVGAVIVNVTATAATAPSFVTVWPTGSEMPTASSLNMITGQTVPNLVVAKVGDDGQISLFNRFGATDLVVDVVAYAPADSTLVALTPARVLDTRDETGGPPGVVSADTAIELDALGVGGVPKKGVTGVLLNVTSANATAPSFVTTWPNGLPRPLASSLNMMPDEVVPNLVLAPVGAGGKIRLYNRAGSTHLVADVVAYLEPPAGVTATVIADETIAVTSDQIESITGDPDADDVVTIRFDADAEIEVGSIVVAPPMGGAPSGLLRRVTAITSGPGGVLVATTERATLTDAVPEGSFDVTAAADRGLARLTEAAVPLGTSAYDRSLGCGTSVQLQTSVDGGIDSYIDFSLDWDPSGLHSANVTVGLDVILNLQASATAAVACEANATLFSVALAPIAVPIGGIPFFFVPELSLDLKATGSLQGSLSGTADYGVQITAGIVYDENTGIDTVAAVTPTANSDWTASATAAAGVELTPKLVLAAYGLGGPEAGVPFGVNVELDPCRTPLWKLTSSIKASIGIALSGWLGSITLAQTEFTLNENVIAEGGAPIPNFPGCAPPLVVTRDSVSSSAVTNAGSSISYDIADLPPVDVEDNHQQEVAEYGDAVSGLESVLVDGVVVVTRPYAPGATATASSSSAVAGASANAVQESGLSISESADAWTFVLSEVLTASKTTDEDYDEPIDGDTLEYHYYAGVSGSSVVTVSFEIVEPMILAAATCPPNDIYTRVFFTFGQTDLTDANGCIVPGPLQPGTYGLALHRYSTSQPPSGLLSVTITKP